MFVSVDEAARLLGVADPIDESTPEAVAHWKREDLRIVMLTGSV